MMASVAHSAWAPGGEKNDAAKGPRPSGDSASARGRGGARGRGRGRGRGGYRGGKGGNVGDAPTDSKPAAEASTPTPATQVPPQQATNTSTNPTPAVSAPASTNTTTNANDSQSRPRPQRKRSNAPPIIVAPSSPKSEKASKNNRKRNPKPPSRKSSLASTSARSDGEPSPIQSGLVAPRTDLDSLVNRTRAMAMGSSVPPSPDMRSFTPTMTWADTENEELPELDDTWVKKTTAVPPTIAPIAEAQTLALAAPTVEVDSRRLSTSSIGSAQAKENKEIPPHQQKKEKGKGRDNFKDRQRSNQPTPPPRSPYVPPAVAGLEPRPMENNFRGADPRFSPRPARGGFAFPRGMRGGGPARGGMNNYHHHNGPQSPPVHTPPVHTPPVHTPPVHTPPVQPPPAHAPPVHTPTARPAAPPVQEVTFASLNDPAPEEHAHHPKYFGRSPSHANTSFHSPGRGRHINFNAGFSHQAYSPSNPTSPSSPPGHMRNPSSPHSSGHSRSHSRPVISLDGFAKISKSLGGVPIPARGTPKSDAAILSSPPAAT